MPAPHERVIATRGKRSPIKPAITALALAFIVVRIFRPSVAIDATTVALLVVAIAPWLWEFVESAEFPGGWKVQFREVQVEQQRQQSEIQSLRFLVTHFLSEAEVTHLTKLTSPAAFHFEPSSFFENELRRLRALGLIKGLHGTGVRSLRNEGRDVKDHFCITERGLEYLLLRKQAEEDEQQQE